jgi:hypothetical protein
MAVARAEVTLFMASCQASVLLSLAITRATVPLVLAVCQAIYWPGIWPAQPYLLARSRYLLVCLFLLLLIRIILGATGCLRARALWHISLPAACSKIEFRLPASLMSQAPLPEPLKNARCLESLELK